MRIAVLKDFEYETDRQEMFQRAESAFEALGELHPDGCRVGMLGVYCVLIEGKEDDGTPPVLVEHAELDFDQESLDDLWRYEQGKPSVMQAGARTPRDVVRALDNNDCWDEGEGGPQPSYEGGQHVFVLNEGEQVIVVEDDNYDQARRKVHAHLIAEQPDKWSADFSDFCDDCDSGSVVCHAVPTVVRL